MLDIIWWMTSGVSVGVNPNRTIGSSLRRLVWPEVFDDLLVNEVDAFSFDFTEKLRDGETMVNTAINVCVINGADSSPVNIVKSDIDMNMGGMIASVLISSGIPNAGYMLAMKTNTNMGRTLIVEGSVRVMPACAP